VEPKNLLISPREVAFPVFCIGLVVRGALNVVLVSGVRLRRSRLGPPSLSGLTALLMLSRASVPIMYPSLCIPLALFVRGDSRFWGVGPLREVAGLVRVGLDGFFWRLAGLSSGSGPGKVERGLLNWNGWVNGSNCRMRCGCAGGDELLSGTLYTSRSVGSPSKSDRSAFVDSLAERNSESSIDLGEPWPTVDSRSTAVCLLRPVSLSRRRSKSSLCLYFWFRKSCRFKRKNSCLTRRRMLLETCKWVGRD